MYKIECAISIHQDYWYVVGSTGVNICQCNSEYAARKIAKALNKQTQNKKENLI